MTITRAISAHRTIELKLPRTYLVGEFPTAEIRTIQDTEAQRDRDFRHLVREYGRLYHVVQEDENGNTLRENNYRNVERNLDNLQAMGF